MTGSIKANGRQSDRPPLTIYLAAPRGFCAGVDRAIQIVELALAKYGAPVYVRHAIVHNRYVVESLKAKGAIFVEELDEIPDTDAPIVFSAHGVPKAVPEAARAAQSVLSRCHLPARLQGACRGRAPVRRRPRDIADRPCRSSRGGRHHRPIARRRRASDRDGGRRARLHPARSRPARRDHPDHAVGRRHQGDRRRAQGTLPAHDHAAQGRHLLRHH